MKYVALGFVLVVVAWSVTHYLKTRRFDAGRYVEDTALVEFQRGIQELERIANGR